MRLDFLSETIKRFYEASSWEIEDYVTTFSLHYGKSYILALKCPYCGETSTESAGVFIGYCPKCGAGMLTEKREDDE